MSCHNAPDFPPYNMIGRSAALLQVINQLPVFAQSPAPVLILGESGTGKEKAAAALHALGPRKDRPFVAINVAALPAALLESELFGHIKGAFTGAQREHKGLVAEAEGGTLFLDEIGDMDVSLQAKLLRFTESGEYRPVGSSQTCRSNVRLITATHRDLKQRVRDGLFRDDLYYRLAVLNLTMPALRERISDIPLLVEYFLKDIATREKKNTPQITPAALHKLQSYAWPGNIRELIGVLTRAVILYTEGTLTAEMIDLEAAPTAQTPTAPPPPVKSLREAENEAIQSALFHCNGNVLRAAALLQVAPSTLYRRGLRDVTGGTH